MLRPQIPESGFRRSADPQIRQIRQPGTSYTPLSGKTHFGQVFLRTGIYGTWLAGSADSCQMCRQDGIKRHFPVPEPGFWLPQHLKNAYLSLKSAPDSQILGPPADSWPIPGNPGSDPGFPYKVRKSWVRPRISRNRPIQPGDPPQKKGGTRFYKTTN